MKRKLTIILFCAFVVALTVVLMSCGLTGGSGKKNHATTTIEVEDMPVKGTIEGDVYYDPDTDGIVWNAVSDASYYLVKFGSEDSTRQFQNNFAGINYFAGDNVFSVFAVRDNNTKTEVKTQEFSKTELNISIDKATDSVKWTGDENATGYKITIRNTDVKNDSTELTAEAGATSAPLTCINPGYGYYVSVKSTMAKGTVLPSDDHLSDIRRVRNEQFAYNGMTFAFQGFPETGFFDNDTYTHHFTIGEEEVIINDHDRSYSYMPTGGDFTASLYTESTKGNYLNSVKQTITVEEKPAATNLICNDEGVLTWDAVEGANGYRIFINGVDSSGSTENTYTLTTALVTGVLGEIAVRPYFYNNAYSTASNTIKVFRRGVSVKLEFFSYEPVFGEVGTNRLTASILSSDSEIKGFTYNITGAEESTFNVNLAEGVRSVGYEGMNFETAGIYNIAVTPRYEFDDDVVTLGEDNTATYTVTRLPDLTNVEVRAVESNGRIYVEGATGGYVEIIDKSTGNKVSRSQPGTDGDEKYFNLFDTTNQGTISKTFSYSLYNVANKIGTYEYNSWDRPGLKAMTLRSLGKLDVSYHVVGKVSNLSYNVSDNTLSWGYAEAATFSIRCTSAGIDVAHTTATSLDLTSYIDNGAFDDGERHVITVSVDSDINNGYFSSGVVSKNLYGVAAPVLTMYEDSLDYLHISNNTGRLCTMKTTYAVGPHAGETITANVWYLTADHAGATIEIRNTGYVDKNNNQYVNSRWATYTVDTPQTTSTNIVCNSDKTVSWTAVDHVTSYRYDITGDAEASGDRVTNPKTANLSSILTGRKTYSITVKGYGSQDDDVFYLPTEILTDTFYCSSLEVFAMNGDDPNTETLYTTGQTSIRFQLKIVPDDSSIPYYYCNVMIRDGNSPSTIHYSAPGANTNNIYDCTDTINTKPTSSEHPFIYYMNVIGNRHANITFSLANGAEENLLSYKSFLDKTSVVFALYKDYDDHSKYDIRFTSTN